MGVGEIAAAAGSLPAAPDSAQPAPKQEPASAGHAASAFDLTQAVSQANERARALGRQLQFSVDKGSGRTVIKVIDTQTQEVVRQIPPEEMLALAGELQMSGATLLDKRA